MVQPSTSLQNRGTKERESMDVITISSSDEESDPLQLDNVLGEIPCLDANTSRPTVLQKNAPPIPEVLIVDTSQEHEPSSRKRIKLTPVPSGTSPSHNVIEIVKPTNGFCVTQPHKIKTEMANVEEAASTEHNMEDNESELLFRKFTDACKEIGDPGQEMDRIMKRAWHYYNYLNVGYKISKQFKRLLDKNIERVATDPANMYSYMLEVCKEMKSRKLSPPSSGEPQTKRARISNRDYQIASTSGDGQPSINHGSQDTTLSQGAHHVASTSRDCSQDTTVSQNSQENDGDDSDSDRDKGNEEDVKKRRLVKKLNRQLASCSKHIQKLERAEVDWDDDGDSTYIALQTWRDRAVKIYKKICEYTGERDKSSYRIHLNNLDSTSRFPEVDRCIRKFVNNTGEFPDFQDILKIYNEYNVKDQHNLTPIQVHGYAADMFQMIGNELQRKRKLDNWDLHCEYLQDAPDPADDDTELTGQLEVNRKLFITKVNQIVDEFAQKQKEQKLEPVEVTEEEANKSEVDNSDAEEDADTATLEERCATDTDNNNTVCDAIIDNTKLDDTPETKTPELTTITAALGLTRLELSSTIESVQTMSEDHLLTSDICEENTSVVTTSPGPENQSVNRDASLATVVTTSRDDVSAQPVSKDVDFQVCVTY